MTINFKTTRAPSYATDSTTSFNNKKSVLVIFSISYILFDCLLLLVVIYLVRLFITYQRHKGRAWRTELESFTESNNLTTNSHRNPSTTTNLNESHLIKG